MIQRYGQFWFFRKGSGNSFSTTSCVSFSKKNVSHVIFYQLIKFHCLIAFTAWDIWQYVYGNCLFPRLWRHEFEINLILLNKILIILRKKRVLKVKLKAFFIILKVLSVAKNFLRPVSTPLTGVLIYSLTICVLEDGFKDICSENFVIFAEKNSWPSSLLGKSQFVEPDFFWRKRSAKYIS